MGNGAQRGRKLSALIGPADLQVRRGLGEVGEVLLAPGDRVLEQAVTGQRDWVGWAMATRSAILRASSAAGLTIAAGELGRASRGPGQSRPRPPRACDAVRGHPDRVAQLAAGSAAVRAVITGVRRRGGVIRGADRARLRAPVSPTAGRGDSRARGPISADHGSVVMHRCAGTGGTVVGEVELVTREGPLIGGFVGRRVGRRRPPRIGVHQLGVGVDRDADGARGAGVGQREPEQHRAVPVGREIGSLHVQAAHVGKPEAGVAVAREEARRRADPVAVDPEPDAVGELERRRPDSAHLAGDVKTVGIEAAVLETLHVGALAGRHLAAVLQAAGDRQLGRRGARSRREDQTARDGEPEDTDAAHGFLLLPGGATGG